MGIPAGVGKFILGKLFLCNIFFEYFEKKLSCHSVNMMLSNVTKDL